MLDRRTWLAGAALATWQATHGLGVAAPASRRPRVAAVYTELRFRSHAFNILENFFQPYLFRGELVDPGVDVVSLYADQFPTDDMTREVSQRLNIPLYKSIDEALCVGGKELAVDAVLIVGEHGEYPYNDIGQHLYPRKQFFDQALAVMKRSDRYVPIFNDKHLSYRWDWAKEMYDTARKHGIPMLAGSSVPLAERRPNWDVPLGTEIAEAVVVHGGGLESYDFHAFDLLQSFVERRKGGETGVAKIEMLKGKALEAAGDAGRWSRELFQAAMQAERDMDVERQHRPPLSIRTNAIKGLDDKAKVGHGILVTYRDGLKATVLTVGGSSSRWNLALRYKNQSEPQATAMFNGPWGNRCLFKALSHAIQRLFIDRAEPYPLERTLLSTGMTEAAVQSHAQEKVLETPQLAIAYQPREWSSFRENGASWQRLTAAIAQPEKFDPGDEKLIPKK